MHNTLNTQKAAEWELSPTQVGALQTAQVTGALIGCTFGGWLADVLGRRKMAMIASVAVCVLAVHMLFVQYVVVFVLPVMALSAQVVRALSRGQVPPGLPPWYPC